MRYKHSDDEYLNCSTVVIGKGASQTGFVIVGHNEDDKEAIVQLHSVPAKDCPAGTTCVFGDNPHEIELPQHSLSYIWSDVRREGGTSFADSFFNECGVAVVSDSCNSKRKDEEEVQNCFLGYGLRVLIAKQATSARHGVEIAKALVEKYGYFGSRTYHIADKNECWSVQIPRGHRLAAARIPDDHVYFIPNRFTLHKIEFKDKDNFIVSDDIINCAENHGWYSPDVPGDYSDFDFALAYNSPSSGNSEPDSNTVRTRNAWPVLGFDPDMPNPFSYVAQRKYGIDDVKRLLRNHWEGRPDANNTCYECDPHQKGTSPYTLCSPTTVESTITEFDENPRSTVIWRAWLQPCTNPYVPFFIGDLRVPKNYEWMNADKAEKTHFALRRDEFKYNPATAYWQYRTLAWLARYRYAFCHPIISAAIGKYEKDAEKRVDLIKCEVSELDEAEASRKLSAFSLRMAKKADKTVLVLIQKIADGMAEGGK